MANLFQFQDVSKSFGARALFEGVSFGVSENEHIGVIGPNGAGKTTLFKILSEEMEPDRGEVIRKRGLRVGYLSQHDDWPSGLRVSEYLESAQGLPLWDLKSLARSLGVGDDLFEVPILSLSGGYRMRCKLLFLIAQEPDLLLLDEPTNYLDLESIVALESFLQGFSGTFMLISHDREFLRRTTDHILEVEGGEVVKYHGGLDDYLEQKALLKHQLEVKALSIEEKRKEILDFVRRFGAKATKARQAQSRLKSLDKLERIEIRPSGRSARIQIPRPEPTGRRVVKLENVDLGYGETPILRDVMFELRRGDHLAVVGVNGAGKSTLLKGLAGLLPPMRGSLAWDDRASWGYYAQHVTEALGQEDTVLQSLERGAAPDVTRQELLNVAGSLLFSGDDLGKPTAVLSGGEKSRVALGQILLQRASCLLLDEPTNHLDYDTVEALTSALKDYEGVVVVVSHDRGFVASIATKILEIDQGSARFYPGSYDEYVWSLSRGVLSKKDEGGEIERLSGDFAFGESKTPSKDKKSLRKKCERTIKDLEKRGREIEKALDSAEKGLVSVNEKLTRETRSEIQRELVGEIGELQSLKEKLEVEWLELESEKLEVQKQLDQTFE